MIDLVYTPEALDDLESIWRYTAEQWGARQAASYTGRLEAVCETIASSEVESMPFTTDEGSCFMARCEHHRIFFHEGLEIVIIAILHERMDLIRRLEERL